MEFRWDKRATGRTTRMLRAAIEEARSGKTVFVYTNHIEQAHRLMDIAESWSPDLKGVVFSRPYFKLTFPDGGSVSIREAKIERMVIPRQAATVGFDAVEFFDHFAIQKAAEEILDEYHRFDEQNGR